VLSTPNFDNLATVFWSNFVIISYHCSGVFSTGAMGALAPAIFGYFITVSQGQHQQWKNSINILAPAILKS
jgi:hypothetical protein